MSRLYNPGKSVIFFNNKIGIHNIGLVNQRLIPRGQILSGSPTCGVPLPLYEYS